MLKLEEFEVLKSIQNTQGLFFDENLIKGTHLVFGEQADNVRFKIIFYR